MAPRILQKERLWQSQSRLLPVSETHILLHGNIFHINATTAPPDDAEPGTVSAIFKLSPLSLKYFFAKPQLHQILRTILTAFTNTRPLAPKSHNFNTKTPVVAKEILNAEIHADCSLSWYIYSIFTGSWTEAQSRSSDSIRTNWNLYPNVASRLNVDKIWIKAIGTHISQVYCFFLSYLSWWGW